MPLAVASAAEPGHFQGLAIVFVVSVNADCITAPFARLHG
jgi:hypothetical protein